MTVLARAVYASELAGLAGLNKYRSQIESAANWWAREARSTRPCPITRVVAGSGIEVSFEPLRPVGALYGGCEGNDQRARGLGIPPPNAPLSSR